MIHMKSALAVGIVLLWACGGDGGGPAGNDPAPVIGTINVGSIRAGEELVITGQNLSGARAPGGLAPAQGAVTVRVNGRVLTPESVTPTQIRVRIPVDLPPGSYTLTVEVGDRTSPPFPFAVEIFTVTGAYAGTGTIESATCNDPDATAQLQQLFPIGTTGASAEAVIDQRPMLTMSSQNFAETGIITGTGTLDADGTFRVVVDDDDPEVESVKEGTFTAQGTEVRSEQTNTVTLDADLGDGTRLICTVVLQFSETRVSTTPQLARAPVPASRPSGSLATALRALAD